MFVTQINRKSAEMQTISSWWLKRTGISFDTTMTSDFGFMAFENSEPLAALFLYPFMGSRLASLGWPVTDPDADKELRRKGLDQTFVAAHAAAKNLGHDLIWTTTNTPVIEDRLKEMGYVLGDENINQYWKGV